MTPTPIFMVSRAVIPYLKKVFMKKNIAETVRGLVCGPLRDAGFTLWNVKYEKEGVDFVLSVEVDREGGVDMDACSVANDIVEPIVDEADPVTGAYCLEVASAGMYRELLKPEHYAAALERQTTVTVKTFKPVNGLKEFEGKLVAVDDDTVTIDNIKTEKKNIAKITAVFE